MIYWYAQLLLLDYRSRRRQKLVLERGSGQTRWSEVRVITNPLSALYRFNIPRQYYRSSSESRNLNFIDRRDRLDRSVLQWVYYPMNSGAAKPCKSAKYASAFCIAQADSSWIANKPDILIALAANFGHIHARDSLLRELALHSPATLLQSSAVMMKDTETLPDITYF